MPPPSEGLSPTLELGPSPTRLHGKHRPKGSRSRRSSSHRDSEEPQKSEPDYTRERSVRGGREGLPPPPSASESED